ncbi:MAG: biosynthetic-type acetolactate synthase large subunit [Andreesenia angusta]|nr:biosynthetic-type acetolactate synthase large subunit [Andreesenia angusta]
MIVADLIVKCLKKENVELVYGYPGGHILPVYESIRKQDMKHVLVRNEQSAVHNANGYARASKKVGVCLATSGPGATNMITGISTAYMDSVPLVIITGQVPLNQIGDDVFQEADIIGSTEPFTKYNYLVKNKDEVAGIIKKAFKIARTGRPGPVLIDIPKDIQLQKIRSYEYPDDIFIKGYNPVFEGHIGQIKRAANNIKKAKKPVICCGGGVLSSDAKEEVAELVRKTDIPVLVTFMGLCAFDQTNPNYIGMVGMHGENYSNKIIKESDLVIVIGSRVADRSKIDVTARSKKIIQIDIDSAEIGKNLSVDIPIVGDAKNILKDIIERIDKAPEISEWKEYICNLKGRYQEKIEETPLVNPKEAMKFASDNMSDNAILITDVGQNQFWAARNFKFYKDRMIFGSGGLGTMGYSLPASIGAKMGKPDSEVIAVMGDGGIQMLLAELGVVKEQNLDIKIIVFNNARLGMVKELQENSYGRPSVFGTIFTDSPDFEAIAKAFGLRGRTVKNNQEFEEAFKEAMDSKEAFLIEALVDSDFKTL